MAVGANPLAGDGAGVEPRQALHRLVFLDSATFHPGYLLDRSFAMVQHERERVLGYEITPGDGPRRAGGWGQDAG
jgi:hypothetical protein